MLIKLISFFLFCLIKHGSVGSPKGRFLAWKITTLNLESSCWGTICRCMHNILMELLSWWHFIYLHQRYVKNGSGLGIATNCNIYFLSKSNKNWINIFFLTKVCSWFWGCSLPLQIDKFGRYMSWNSERMSSMFITFEFHCCNGGPPIKPYKLACKSNQLISI